jgi:RNA polymerase sigma-70 factor (ECF subfamily)
LHRWVRRFGVAERDGEDLVQEMFLLLCVHLPKFRYDPARSFRAWLWTICRRMAGDWNRRRHPISLNAEMLNDVAGPDAVAELDEAEYANYIIERGLAVVRADFDETTWRVFVAVTLEERPGVEVAREVGLTPNAVYLIRARVLARMRAELADFRE